VKEKPIIEPITVRVPVAQMMSGISRSELYRWASLEKLKLVKHGRTVLVDVASLKELIATLPTFTPKAAPIKLDRAA
jgi:hypothetical protein